jgi:ribose-phosphate pyrophosphokinase
VSAALSTQVADSTAIPLEYNKRLMLFSGRANPALAGEIARKLGVGLGGVTLNTFSNGEVYCRYEESIRGADVFIIQPTCGNPQTGVTANDALMELMFMIDAAVGASIMNISSRTRSRLRASRSPPAWSPACSRTPVPTACSPWTYTPARCRASSRSRWTT